MTMFSDISDSHELLTNVSALKTKGNDLLKTSPSEAIKIYTQGIDDLESWKCIPVSNDSHTHEGNSLNNTGNNNSDHSLPSLLSVLYSNRSQAYILLKQFDNALSDARKSFSIDPNNIKSIYRAGLSAAKLRRWSQAIDLLRGGITKAGEIQITNSISAVNDMTLLLHKCEALLSKKRELNEGTANDNIKYVFNSAHSSDNTELTPTEITQLKEELSVTKERHDSIRTQLMASRSESTKVKHCVAIVSSFLSEAAERNKELRTFEQTGRAFFLRSPSKLIESLVIEQKEILTKSEILESHEKSLKQRFDSLGENAKLISC